MRLIILIIALLLFTTCFMNQNEINLSGKIAVISTERICTVFDNSNISNSQFKLRDDEQYWYDALTWVNKDNSFIGVEGVNAKTRDAFKSNIVRFDLAGNIVERIYESEEGEIVGFAFSSRSDKKLIFTTERIGYVKTNPLEGLSRPKSLVVMDFNEKKVIKKIGNAEISPNFELHESPWLYDEYHFIYSISGENKIIVEGEEINPVEQGSAGVYVYDLKTGQHKLLVADGRFGISSPVKGEIAYIHDQSVWVLDLKDNAKKMVYKGGSKEKVSNIHWTPDGKYIYLVYFNYYLSDLFTSGEKLIDISNSREVPFRKIGHGFKTYTWK